MKGHIKTICTQLLWMIACILLLTGCDLFGDDEPNIPGPASCSDEDYNQYVYDVMKRYYFWYNEVDPFNQINPKDTIAYPNPQSLIDMLKYSPLDRFSGVSNAGTFNQFYGEGKFLGVGLRLLTDEITGHLMVAYASAGSPAANAGIKRGDRLVEINGYAANGLSGDDWTTAWGPSEIGNEVQLLVEHTDSSTELLTVAKAIVSIQTTQNSTTIDSGDKKVGYLHFTNFLGSTAIENLNKQFSTFQQQGINELIVDLRYNGGGAVATARHLGSLIGGDKTANSLFTKMIYNKKSNGYDGYKQALNFSSLTESLALNRVIFITTEASCSASELLINSLIPNSDIEVIVVGSKTCGKPVGSKPQSHCNKSLAVINFEVINAANQGQYFEGISAGYSGLTAFCDATDDISVPLGNMTENSLSTALDYLANGQCNVTKKKSGMRLKPIGQPLQLENEMY